MGHGFNAVGRMCPPPRSLAAEADGCFMVRTRSGSNRIQGCGAMLRAQGGLPSDRQFTKRCSAFQAEGRPIQTRYVTEAKAMPRGCKPEGDHALSNAERQARHRARQHDRMLTPVIRYRRPVDRRSRAQRWCDAVSELVTLHPEYIAWLDALPDSLRTTPTGEALQAIADLDLDALAAVDPPRGYGRD